MPSIDRVDAFADELTAMRRDFHAHPEIGFEEVRTSGIVAEKLKAWGIEVHRGVGRTGVVGVLKGRGAGGRRIGLRADMDALPMDEETNLPYRSKRPGRFHGCGHDGHTTMLLGAARYLAETRKFDGTVVFIFPTAEEKLVRARIRALASGIAAGFAATIEVDIRDIFTVLENHEAQTGAAAEAAREIVGEARIDPEPRPKMASEDFADMLRAVPGAYFWLGQTPGPAVHNPGYIFDDGILPIGASLLARIAARQLAGGKV